MYPIYDYITLYIIKGGSVQVRGYLFRLKHTEVQAYNWRRCVTPLDALFLVLSTCYY